MAQGTTVAVDFAAGRLIGQAHSIELLTGFYKTSGGQLLLYAQGQLEVKSANEKLVESIGKNEGALFELNKGLADTTTQTNAFNAGALDAAVKTAQWAQGLNTAKGEVVGITD